jgi:hypothetical protein
MRKFNYQAIIRTISLKIWDFFILKISEYKIKRNSNHQEIYTKELRENFKQISLINTLGLNGSAKIWADNCNKLKKNIETQDPRMFLQWPVVKESMFVQDAPFIYKEYDLLIDGITSDTRWDDVVIENCFGSPSRMLFNYKWSSNLIHHAFHFYNFQKSTDLKIKDFHLIFEFGGGYGSLARLANQIGFEGQYIIFDLPNFSFLQRYFLQNLGYKLLTLDELFIGQKGIYCSSNIEEIFSLKEYINSKGSSLFIATWSYSETPLEFREQFLSFISHFKSHLIAYQDVFEKIDNILFFKHLRGLMANIEWYDCNVETLPSNKYMFGKVK